MDCKLSFQRYRRAFTPPLRTAHGEWSVREGFIVRVEQGSAVGYGEVAPIPEFGTETLEVADTYLKNLTADRLQPKNSGELAELPCCAFGISAAIEDLQGRSIPMRDYPVAALLPAGRAALDRVKVGIEQGYETFKWKIGVDPFAEEQRILEDLLKRLPANVRLRLDANGGLSVEIMERWLMQLKHHSEQIDYLEQPLPVGQESLMADYAETFKVPVALDESLNGLGSSRWLEAGAWSGPLVIKPALMGDREELIERLRPVAGQVVLSSVFETAVGLENTLSLADELPGLKRAIGFGTISAFADNLTVLESASVIHAARRVQVNLEGVYCNAVSLFVRV